MASRAKLLKQVRTGADVRALARASLDAPHEPWRTSTRDYDPLAPHKDKPKWQQTLLWLALQDTKESAAIRAGQSLFARLNAGNSRDFAAAFGLGASFAAWWEGAALHFALANARLRAEGAFGRRVAQEAFDKLWADAETGVHDLGFEQSINRKKVMKDLSQSYLGSVVAYDVGVAGSDVDLASALWRNVCVSPSPGPFHRLTPTRYKCGALDTDARALAGLTRYVRAQVHHLDRVPAHDLVRGWWDFVPVDKTQG